MNKNLIALMLVALVLSLAACGTPAQKPAPAPAPSTAPGVADDIGSVDQVSEDVNVDSLDDVDAGLSDLEQLDI